GDGFLACRWTGPGRLAEPADIVEAAAHLLSPQDLAGKRIVVTAGPTHEAIDPARFLGNRSSGKMGAALAAAAQRRGAVVTLLLGFAAETQNIVENAKAKLGAKRCDMVIANDVSEPGAGFAVDTNRVTVVDRDGATELAAGPKAEVAHRILDRVAARLPGLA